MVKFGEMTSERSKAAENVPDEASIWKMLEEAIDLTLESSGNENSLSETSFKGTFPTRFLKFPEIDSNAFASNLRNFGSESALMIEFYGGRYEKSIFKSEIYVPETTTIAIFVGIARDKLTRFKIKSAYILPSSISYTPKIPEVSMNEGREIKREFTTDDFDSFNAAIGFVKDKRGA